MRKLCTDIEGAIFAYHHNDEIVIIVRNDQNSDTLPWCSNRVQKICSITSDVYKRQVSQPNALLASPTMQSIMSQDIDTSQTTLVVGH